MFKNRTSSDPNLNVSKFTAAREKRVHVFKGLASIHVTYVASE